MRDLRSPEGVCANSSKVPEHFRASAALVLVRQISAWRPSLQWTEDDVTLFRIPNRKGCRHDISNVVHDRAPM